MWEKGVRGIVGRVGIGYLYMLDISGWCVGEDSQALVALWVYVEVTILGRIILIYEER